MQPLFTFRHDRNTAALTCSHPTRSRPCSTPLPQHHPLPHPLSTALGKCRGGSGGVSFVLLCLRRHSRPPAAAFVAFGLALISQAKRDKSATICTSGKRSEERQVFPNVLGWLVCCACVLVQLTCSFILPSPLSSLPLFFSFFFQIRLCIQTDGSRLLAPPHPPPAIQFTSSPHTDSQPTPHLPHSHTHLPFLPSHPPPHPVLQRFLCNVGRNNLLLPSCSEVTSWP